MILYLQCHDARNRPDLATNGQGEHTHTHTHRGNMLISDNRFILSHMIITSVLFQKEQNGERS